jgi:hypothetical protein
VPALAKEVRREVVALATLAKGFGAPYFRWQKRFFADPRAEVRAWVDLGLTRFASIARAWRRYRAECLRGALTLRQGAFSRARGFAK